VSGDPLSHLRNTVIARDDIGAEGGWEVHPGDSDDRPDLIFFDRSRPGWVRIDDMDGSIDQLTLPEVINLIGPVQGEIAVRQGEILLERLRPSLAHEEWQCLAEDVAAGTQALSQRIHLAQQGHAAEAAAILAELAAMGVLRPVDAPADDLSLAYLVRLVYREGDTWVIYDDEDDENPAICRLSTPSGWSWRLEHDSQEQPLDVAQVCRIVGPRHAAQVLRQTADLAGELVGQMNEELQTARAEVAHDLEAAVRTHAWHAKRLEQMGRLFPPPDGISL